MQPVDYRRALSHTLLGVDGEPLTDLRTRWRWLLLAACVCWLGFVFAPPFVSDPDLLRWLLHPGCHQIPGRSFHLLGEPIAVCHRCTGLYVGFTLGVLLWPWIPGLATKLTTNPRWVGLFFVPLLVDWAVTVNTPASRFATGVVASFPVAVLPLVALVQWAGSNKQCKQEGVT